MNTIIYQERVSEPPQEATEAISIHLLTLGTAGKRPDSAVIDGSSAPEVFYQATVAVSIYQTESMPYVYT